MLNSTQRTQWDVRCIEASTSLRQKNYLNKKALTNSHISHVMTILYTGSYTGLTLEKKKPFLPRNFQLETLLIEEATYITY